MHQQLLEMSNEQLEALVNFSCNEGKFWKKSLLSAWHSGRYPRHVDMAGDEAAYLQQIRNTYGNAWLQSVRPDDMAEANKKIAEKALFERNHADYKCYLLLKEHAHTLISGLTIAVRAETMDEEQASDIEKVVNEAILSREELNNKVIKLAGCHCI
ncbi:MAG: hypothetical protein AB2784_21790 [Candidatus Thiodiazotropha endolucinida]